MKINRKSKFYNFLRRFFALSGPGYMIAVGYMDPGNWATDLAGGSQFGYALLSVVLISNFMAILLQYCSLKLGIVTGKDLAQACRDYYSKKFSILLWILAECAVIATDLAEVIGSAIALQLLFGIPLLLGVCITAADVLLLLILSGRKMRWLELIVIFLIVIITICFGIIIFIAQPSFIAILNGCIPTTRILTDPNMLYLAIGILGATVMPHNLYLHSALVRNDPNHTDKQKEKSIFYSGLDMYVALTFAFFVNAAILIVSAAVFYKRGFHGVAEIQDAYYLFTPLLSTGIASFLFAVALLISGQNSTLTGTLAGQIILEGFTSLRIPIWLRRLVGRLITIVPAVVGIIWIGECCLSQMMIFSQIILSLQLPFAVFPLIQFTNDSKIMGRFANAKWIKITAYACGSVILIMNTLMVYFLLV